MSTFRASRQPKSDKIQLLSLKKGNTICNLCRLKKNLTYDHVPPQCCGNDKAIRARRIYAEELVARQVDAKSGNGLKFRTLCKDCNGKLLGPWDAALGEFAESVERIAEPRLELPDQVSISIKAGAVVRSILGHIVAAKVHDDEVTTDARVREYLNGRAPLPASFKVYCWLYPFEGTIVSRDFTFVDLEPPGRKSPGLVSVIKFYPLAFCLIDGDGSLFEDYVSGLHQYAASEPHDTTTIRLLRKPLVQPGYPERAIGNHLVLGGSTYIDSVTTVADGGAFVTPGRRVLAERWESGDTKSFRELHAFAEIADLRRRQSGSRKRGA